MKLFVTLMVAGLVGSQGLVASQQSDSAPHRHMRSDPWSGLFVVEPLPTPEGQSVTVLPLPSPAFSALPERHQPERGPCNMPIVPANPDVDRGMIVPIPADRVDAKIRIVEPTICGHTNLWGAEFVQAVPTRHKIESQTFTIDRKR